MSWIRFSIRGGLGVAALVAILTGSWIDRAEAIDDGAKMNAGSDRVEIMKK